MVLFDKQRSNLVNKFTNYCLVWISLKKCELKLTNLQIRSFIDPFLMQIFEFNLFKLKQDRAQTRQVYFGFILVMVNKAGELVVIM